MKSLAQKLCIGGVLMLVMVASAATALPARAVEQELLDRIRLLEQRISELEAKQSETAIAPSSQMPSKTLEFLRQTEISGGIMATWFTDFSKPGSAGTAIPLLGIGTYNHDAFSVNLAEITLSNLAEPSADNWDGGFKVSVLLGEDVSGLADGLDFGGGIGAVWEAYASLNLPIGNGVVAKVGKFATYHGNEVVQPWANRNITYGFQFALVEPFTHTGLALETALNDKLALVLSVNNGWDQTFESGDGPSFWGQLKFTPADKTVIVLNGFVGPETGEASELRSGADVVITQQLTDTLSATLQADVGWQEFDSSADADWYAVGGWLAWDPSERWGLSLRGEWINGSEGIPGTGFTSGLGENGLTLLSGTATVAFRPPVPGLEGRLEIRYDNTNDESLFAGANDRVILSLGALYAF